VRRDPENLAGADVLAASTVPRGGGGKPVPGRPPSVDGAGAALAELARVRAAASELEAAELAALEAARAAGATWGQIAAVLGMRGRTGAQKRHSDLARRRPRVMPGTTPPPGGPAAPGTGIPGPPPAPRPPDVDISAGPAAAGAPPARARRDAGLEPGWTVDIPDSGSEAFLYGPDGTLAGSAARAGLAGSRWEARTRNGGAVFGGPWPSRRKALAALAAEAERARRERTPAGKNAGIPGLPGWTLTRTLADKDAGRWRVTAPDGTVKGTITRRDYGGPVTWEAMTGEPGSALRGVLSGDHVSGDWSTRHGAARAVAGLDD
jgi:hypothetical protein